MGTGDSPQFPAIKTDAVKDAGGTKTLAEVSGGEFVWGANVPDGTVWTLAAEQATTSGTSFDFTGIPAGTKQIVLMGASVSQSSTPDFLVQIGDSGGIETTGYLSRYARVSGTHTQSYDHNAGFHLFNDAASLLNEIVVQLFLQDSANNTWVASYVTAVYSTTITSYGGGSKSLSGELTQVRFTTTGGTDAFDAGGISIQYI